MKKTLTLTFADEAATCVFSKQLASICPDSALIYLRGSLGVGKTTLIRAFLRAKGITGTIRSPTYTLVEVYQDHLYHFDLYRLESPEELEYIGFRDYLIPPALCLIEWPERGEGMLPEPDLDCEMTMVGEQRQMRLTAKSQLGEKMLVELMN